jgi:hypothetical protein
MPTNLQSGLQHVLEVVRLVHQSGIDRLTAVKHVAKQHRIDPQTVAAACTRSLGLNTRAFDEFLARENAEDFCQHLVRRFPQEQASIESFFAGVVGQPPPSSPEDPTRIVKTLFPEEMKQVRDAILLRAVRDSLARWLERIDLPRDLKREMRDLHEQL